MTSNYHVVVHFNSFKIDDDYVHKTFSVVETVHVCRTRTHLHWHYLAVQYQHKMQMSVSNVRRDKSATVSTFILCKTRKIIVTFRIVCDVIGR